MLMSYYDSHRRQTDYQLALLALMIIGPQKLYSVHLTLEGVWGGRRGGERQRGGAHWALDLIMCYLRVILKPILIGKGPFKYLVGVSQTSQCVTLGVGFMDFVFSFLVF